MTPDRIERAVGPNSQISKEINPVLQLKRLRENIAGLEREILGIKEKLFPLRGKSMLLQEDQASYAESLALKEAQFEAWSARAADMAAELDAKNRAVLGDEKKPPIS